MKCPIVTVMKGWFILHRGRQVVLGACFCGATFALFAHRAIQLWGADRYLPLWALSPATLGLIASVGFGSRLGSEFPCEPRRELVARIGWLVALLVITACGAAPIALVIGDRAIISMAVLIVLVTAGVATLHHYAAVLFCMVLNMIVVVAPGNLDGPQAMHRVVVEVPSLIKILIFVGAVCGAAAWVRRGAL